MRRERSSLEEVSRIPLSYRVLKKSSVYFSEGDTRMIDTEFDIKVEDKPIDEAPVEEREKVQEEETYDLEEIKSQIRESLYLEMEQKRAEVIDEANKKAEDIKLEAQREGFRHGHNQGYQNGYKEGLDKAKDEGKTIKENALSLIDQCEVYVSQYLEENKHKIIKLAADMAESIVGFAIDTSSDDILMLIKPILQSYDKKESIIITCNSQKYAHIKENLKELEEMCPDSKFIILKDDNLEINDCIIENEHQISDLRIKEQLKAILEEIKHME